MVRDQDFRGKGYLKIHIASVHEGKKPRGLNSNLKVHTAKAYYYQPKRL